MLVIVADNCVVEFVSIVDSGIDTVILGDVNTPCICDTDVGDIAVGNVAVGDVNMIVSGDDTVDGDTRTVDSRIVGSDITVTMDVVCNTLGITDVLVVDDSMLLVNCDGITDVNIKITILVDMYSSDGLTLDTVLDSDDVKLVLFLLTVLVAKASKLIVLVLWVGGVSLSLVFPVA